MLRLFQRSVLLYVFLFAFALYGQIRSGTLTGAVVDPSGAAIPDAEVIVVEEGTNQTYNTVSNSAGGFSVPYLPFGVYSVECRKAGFTRAKQTSIQLSSSQTLRVEIRMGLSTVATALEVSASVVDVQTDSATVQSAINTKLIENVANLNRNPLYFTTLSMGIVGRAAMGNTGDQNSFGIGINGRRAASAFSVNGGQAFTNDIQVDGVSVQGSAWNEVSVLPNPDGVQEVRTTINNYSAEYGRAQGVVSMITKSGTNQFHGTVSYRHRNDSFNANEFSRNARGMGKEKAKIHNLGATFGGPVIKDKAFFFASWEGMRFNQQVDRILTVPTALERKGDFSQTYVNVNGVPSLLKLYDPRSVVPTGRVNEWERAAVPNSIIGSPDRRALQLFSYYPLPNRTPDTLPYTGGNYLSSAIRTFRRNNITSRFDYRLGDKQSLYFTAGGNIGDIVNPLTWGDGGEYPWYSGPGEGTPRYQKDRNPYISVGDTIMITPTLVVDVRAGTNRISTGSLVDDTPDFPYGEFGISRNIEDVMVVRRLPSFQNASHWTPLSQNRYMHKDEKQTNSFVSGSATKILSKWTLKFGGEFRNMLSNYTDAQEAITYNLNQGLTAGPFVNATGGTTRQTLTDNGGHAMASFLMGGGFLEIGRGFNIRPAFSQKYMAFYTQNDWRVTSKLTLNLGLRYDIQPGTTDRFDRMSAFDYSRKNAFGTNGSIIFPGHDGYGRNLWKTRWSDFGPRFGFAYRLQDDFVIRGGYGMTYLPTNTGYYDGPYNYGMAPYTYFTQSNYFGANPAGVLIGDFQQTTNLVSPTGANLAEASLYGAGSPRFDYNNFKNGRAQQWNLFLEKKIGGAWLASVGYSASRGTQLPYNVPLNSNQFIDPAVLGQWRQDYISRAGVGHMGNDLVPNPFQPASGPRLAFQNPLNQNTVARNVLYQAYPLLAGGLQVKQTPGWSDYHAFQTKIEQRYTNGLQMMAHYTWSKATGFSETEVQMNGFADNYGFAGPSDFRNYANNARLLSNDIPHRFVATAVYELPFGTGKAFASGKKWVDGVVGGWQVSGVYTLQSGAPLLLNAGLANAINGRPDIDPNAPWELPAELQRWYDGRTTVTLPSGRTITPPNFTFLKYNPDKFNISGHILDMHQLGSVANPSDPNRYRTDIYYWGNAALTYNEFRAPRMNNLNLTVTRRFKVSERISMELAANAQNALNHTQFNAGAFTTNLGGADTRNPAIPLSAHPDGVPAVGKLGYSTSNNSGSHGMGTLEPRQMEFVLKFRF